MAKDVVGRAGAPPPQASEDADERILKAAGKLFREKGFAATTVREIAAAASMLPGSLHYRYASKDDVLIALMKRAVLRAMGAVELAIATVTDPVERVRVGLRTHLELLCSGDDSLYVLLFDWRSLEPSARAGLERERGRYETFWDGLLLGAHATGQGRPVLDLELVRHFGFGAINWVATWYRPDGERTPAQIADTFFSYLAFGLLHESARPADLDPHFAALMAAATPSRS
ncbi:MAG: TetR family transcriptional regulator [Myxococcaceae bacterium]|nr:TetR family transcriptional regulator [Myxococcaceae bacterium]